MGTKQSNHLSESLYVSIIDRYLLTFTGNPRKQNLLDYHRQDIHGQCDIFVTNILPLFNDYKDIKFYILDIFMEQMCWMIGEKTTSKINEITKSVNIVIRDPSLEKSISSVVGTLCLRGLDFHENDPSAINLYSENGKEICVKMYGSVDNKKHLLNFKKPDDVTIIIS